MGKSEVHRLRSIRQYLLVGLSFLFSGGIALLVYDAVRSLTLSYWLVILLALALNFLLLYQIQIIWMEIRRREKSEKALQSHVERCDELEQELKMLHAEKEQAHVDTRDVEQQIDDLLASVLGDSRTSYIESYFTLVGQKWELMQGLLYLRQEDDVFRIAARYAYYNEQSDLDFVVGETLLGQVAKEEQALYIDRVDTESIIVVSGTGSSRPCSLYIVPFTLEGEKVCWGVLELAFFKTLDEKERELLARFTERVATEFEKKSK